MRSRFECGLRDAKFSRISRLRGWLNPIASRNRARDFQSRTSKTYWVWRVITGTQKNHREWGPPPRSVLNDPLAPERHRAICAHIRGALLAVDGVTQRHR